MALAARHDHARPRPPGPSDEQLVARARGGDGAAFAALVERYQRPVHALARRLLRHPDDAEDAAQETFLRAYTRLDSYRPGSDFRAWLLAIAAHRCLDQLRRKRAAPLAVDEVLAAPGDGPEEVLLRAERRREVARAVAALPAHYRAVVDLRYRQGYSYSELGPALGIPLTTMRMRLFRAHRRLRAALADTAGPGG